MRKRVLIMGAAGRDFHNFNTYFRDNKDFSVAAFTATQIPFIESRIYPRELAGPLYPNGIPIHHEDELPFLVKKYGIDTVVFSYSDVSNDYIMNKASFCTVLGMDFILLGYEKTMLKSMRPVISVCAVRTGCGKSGVSRYIAKVLRTEGKRPALIRHPMPYGDLLKQRAQRFSAYEDMIKASCTIEEMEEYEPLIEAGFTVYAGVDYEEILKMAEAESDIIIWDGGNNDPPFIKPDLSICVTDPFRPGHETTHYHGLVNLKLADIAVINKTNSASAVSVEKVAANIRRINVEAKIIKTASVVHVEGDIKGKRVLIIEDGPTLTHGGMGFGAGFVAAKENGAIPTDPRPYALGTIKAAFDRYPHIEKILPAMGYSASQVKELEDTINATPCDIVLVATPIDLSRLVDIKKPHLRVRYEIEEAASPGLADTVRTFLKGLA